MGNKKTDIKEEIVMTVKDLVTDFLFYDRKEDVRLPRGAIERAIKKGAITVEEIERTFCQELRAGLGQ
jgi:hypothetical protein